MSNLEGQYPATILVPLDGSPLAEQALPVAERLSHAISGHVILVRSVQVFTFPGVDARDAQVAALSAAQQYVDTQASRWRSAGLVVETGIPYGEAVAEILNEISIHQADLIVMATHGRSGVGRWLYGSVADEILRRAPVPVVLVPPGTPRAQPGDRRPVVLVPLDGSELAETALGPAGELATRLSAELVLLQVVSLPPYGLYGEAGEYLALDPAAELMQAERYLAEIVGRLRATLAQVRMRADVGYPGALIAQAAVQEKADLICMATHGRGGVARMVLGSVATDVLRRTNVPLLLVRPAALREPTTPPSSAPELAAQVATTAPVVQTPLSVDELRLLQRGLGELLYKPGGDPELAPRVRDLRDRLGRMERAAGAEPIAAAD